MEEIVGESLVAIMIRLSKKIIYFLDRHGDSQASVIGALPW